MRKIKIGYVSDGFRDFTTTHNLTGVFENHDRSKFKIYAYSFGARDKSKYFKRVWASFDKISDITNISIDKTASLIKRDEIDILVDLKGFTRGARPEIFTLAPSPIIVNYLGFIGTMASKNYDYFIADKTVAPPKIAKYFTEKIIYLPDTYWPTDNKLEIWNTKYERKDFGIPKNTFVFGSFNQVYKIEGNLFASWMKIMRKVPGCVLFIYADDLLARRSIIKNAREFKIHPERIIFAKELPKDRHLARIRDVVDLNLDTNIINGHTTTTDSLWAGVPVITVLGKHFASRVSASMLKAIGLPELITKNLNEYEDLAVSLAKNPKKLLTINSKLKMNKLKYPLFDTEKYTRNLERAYEIMWSDYESNSRNH